MPDTQPVTTKRYPITYMRMTDMSQTEMVRNPDRFCGDYDISAQQLASQRYNIAS